MEGRQRYWLAARLRRCRQRSGLTQNELADRSGVAVRTITDLERAEHAPFKDTRKRLADALELEGAEYSSFINADRAYPRSFGVPEPPDDCFGREDQVTALCQLVQRDDASRRGPVVTLTGPPGVGKTRLAIEVAQRLHGFYDDGVAFVSLAALSNARHVPSAVLLTLDQHAVKEDAAQQLVTYLRDKHLLIVLDNLEHLPEAVPFISDLWQRCRKLTLLVTSRSHLHIRGEQRIIVEPLAVPLSSAPSATAYAVVKLFEQRARGVDPSFTLSDANVAPIVEICRRLDGLPLAIELAAGHSRLLTPHDLKERLKTRLPLLTHGAVDGDPRQRTMRDAIAWSVDLLETHERSLFRQVAVFRGPCTVEAAERVCTAPSQSSDSVLVGLISLVDKSLLRMELDAGGEKYLGMLQVIHEYALEQLTGHSDEAILRQRHAEHYCTVAQCAEAELEGREQGPWLRRLEAQRDNLRAALEWCRDRNQAELGLRLAAALWRFWSMRGPLSEGRDYLAYFLKASVSLPSQGVDLRAARARALDAAGRLARAQGDYEEAFSHLSESVVLWVQLVNDSTNLQTQQAYRHRLADAYNGLAYVELSRRDSAEAAGDHVRASFHLEQAQVNFERSLTLFDAVGDKHGVAKAQHNLAVIAAYREQWDMATRWWTSNEHLWHAVGDKAALAATLDNLGNVAQKQGKLDEARSRHEESLALREELGDKQGCATSLFNYASMLQESEEHLKAIIRYRESLALHSELGDRPHCLSAVSKLALLAHSQGDDARAVRLFSAVNKLCKTIDAPEHDPAQWLAEARTTLGDEAYDEAWAAGQLLSLETAIAQALS